VFDIRFSNYLLLNWLASASDEQCERFAQMERMLLRVAASSEQSDLENSLASRFKNMTNTEPYILEWVLGQPGSDGAYPKHVLDKDGEPEPAVNLLNMPPPQKQSSEDVLGKLGMPAAERKRRKKSDMLVQSTNEVVNMLALLTVADRGHHAQMPGLMIFNEDALGVLLTWCSDRAKSAEKELIHQVLADVKQYDHNKRMSMTPLRLLWEKIQNASQTKKIVDRDLLLQRLYKEREADKELKGYSRTFSGRLQFRSSSNRHNEKSSSDILKEASTRSGQATPGGKSVGEGSSPRVRSSILGNLRSASVSMGLSEKSEQVGKGGARKELLDMEESKAHKKLAKLARQLAVQIPCEFVIVVPAGAGTSVVPMVVSGSQASSVEKKSQREKVARRHMSVEPTCPVGMCIANREVVQVRNMLLEDRFDKATRDTERIFSCICVPILTSRTESMRHSSPIAVPASPRRQSWAPINGPVNGLDDTEMVAVLKCCNKVDFVRQMAGIPFSIDDMQLVGLFAEYMANVVHDSNMGREESQVRLPPVDATSPTTASPGAVAFSATTVLQRDVH